MSIRISAFPKNLLASTSFIFCALSCFSYEAFGGGGLDPEPKELSSISRKLATNANDAKVNGESSKTGASGLKREKKEDGADCHR